MKFLCDQCKAKYQIADEKVQGKTLRMKCRKCGHVIEIRAAADAPHSGETMQVAALSDEQAAQYMSKPSVAPAKPTPAATPRPATGMAPRPGGAAAPRPGAGTATRPSGKPAPAAKPAQSGARASAFSKQVGSDAPPPSSRAGAPADLPVEEWYVAIDEVPVGPIRLTELRAKYAQGAVTDDSLVWREGYEEWRPLRSLPDLHLVVREEVSGALVPPRGSSLLPSNTRNSGRITSPTNNPRVSAPSRPAAAPTAPRGGGNSNVIPFVQSRGGAAAARKVEEELDDEATQIASSPFTVPPKPAEPAIPASGPKVIDDPFGSAPAAAIAPVAPVTSAASGPAATAFAPAAQSTVAAEDAGRATMLDRLQARGLSKGTVALIAAACLLFGVVIAVFAVKPKVVERVVEKRVDVPVSVYVPVPGQSAPTAATAAAADPSSSAAKVAVKGTGGGGAAAATTAAPTTTVTNKKLGGLDGPEGPAVPGAGGGTTGGGQALDGKSVETVVASKRVGVRKQCYEPWADKGNASVKVTLRIGADGKVSSSEIASSSGEPAIGQCVQRLAKSWTFPPSEAGGTFNVPFLFGS